MADGPGYPMEYFPVLQTGAKDGSGRSAPNEPSHPRMSEYSLEKTSAHSVLKELNILKHLLRLAVEWEVIPTNPAQGVKSPKGPAGRVRYLQPTELKAVLD